MFCRTWYMSGGLGVLFRMLVRSSFSKFTSNVTQSARAMSASPNKVMAALSVINNSRPHAQQQRRQERARGLDILGLGPRT